MKNIDDMTDEELIDELERRSGDGSRVSLDFASDKDILDEAIGRGYMVIDENKRKDYFESVLVKNLHDDYMDYFKAAPHRFEMYLKLFFRETINE